MRSRVTSGLAPLLGATLALAGCGNGAAGPDSTPGPESTEPASPADLSADEVYRQIDIDGAREDSPLLWRLDEPADPAAADAVRVVQHLEGLAEAIFAEQQPVAETLALLPYLTTPPETERFEGYARGASNPGGIDLHGPRWYTLLSAETTSDEALVLLCYDIGYWTRDGAEGAPRADGQRSSVTAYRLLAADDDAGGPPWRVDGVAYNNVETADGAPALTEEQVAENEQRCDDWATHTLDDR
ncbi:hypothetical protein JQS43_04830 [Natronosporangium hydrolyticum]|uniref:Lipoprotein n=1 Tax=Natronosporangium hydrolyticum TaxID=2811111 RepID=A0A895YCY2_9ACTN|nr:hypothetical protein [Natronosporangium hydrolyticum]QSB15674.1 hypothetical protein JQS43_04830 [Natronosporangium hydrolyticum]